MSREEISMSILHIHKQFTSPHGWSTLSQTQPTTHKQNNQQNQPKTQKPPQKHKNTNQQDGTLLFPDTPGMAWSLAALFFLMAELLTVPLMAWTIKSVARSKGIESSDRLD